MAQGNFIDHIISGGCCWDRQEWGRHDMDEGRTQGSLKVNVFFISNQVVQDVGSQCSNTEGLDGSTSPIIQRKMELDKVCVCVTNVLNFLSKWRFSLPVSQLNVSELYSMVISLSPFTEMYFTLNLHSASFYISLSVSDITSLRPCMTQLFLWLLGSEWSDIIVVAELASFQGASDPQQSFGTQLQSQQAECMVTWQLHPTLA